MGLSENDRPIFIWYIFFAIFNQHYPFNLKSNEAVIHYYYKGKSYYRKIENLQEVKNTEKIILKR